MNSENNKMSKLSKEILQEFIKRGHFKSEPAVKNFISFIKTNEGLDCTQPAAAQVAAKIKGFSIAKRLKKDDKVPSNIADIVEKYRKKKKFLKIATKSTKSSFVQKMKKAQDPIQKAAYFNASIYPDIFILENKLRSLILKILGGDVSWWKKPSITDKIQKYARSIKEDEKETPWLPPNGGHPLYYVTLKHLCKIVELNWPKFNKLGKQNKFLTMMDDLTAIRNRLAHNTELKNRDKNEIKIQIPKILSIIKQAYNI